MLAIQIGGFLHGACGGSQITGFFLVLRFGNQLRQCWQRGRAGPQAVEARADIVQLFSECERCLRSL